MVNQLQVDRLKDLATDIRRRDLEMVHRARLGHIGGDLSATDILTALYFAVLKVDPATVSSRKAATGRQRCSRRITSWTT